MVFKYYKIPICYIKVYGIFFNNSVLLYVYMILEGNIKTFDFSTTQWHGKKADTGGDGEWRGCSRTKKI